MWLTVAIWWFGLLLQLAGIACAIWGVAANQKEYLAPGEKWMFDWALTLGRGVRDVTLRFGRWITGRKGRDVSVSGAATAAASAIGYATVTLLDPWEPLGSESGLDDRVEWLEKRLVEARDRLVTLEENRISQDQATHELSRSLDAQGHEIRAEVRDSVGRLATKGTRLAAAGLAATAVGMTVSALVQGPWTWH